MSATINSMLVELDARIAAVDTERCRITDMLAKWEELEENCVEAYDLLVDARDALSRIV